MSTKKYTCEFCGERHTRLDLINHIDEEHEDLIPKGYTAARIVFNKINKKDKGRCVICGVETKWNEGVWRYDRFCSERCKNEYVRQRNERMMRVHGTTNKLNDPEHQIKMLNSKKSAGTYTFTDGGEHKYIGSYEKQFLEFLDKVMHFDSQDIVSPGLIIPYKFKNEDLFFITDFYLSTYNLLVDIKAGGKNPNTNPQLKEYNEKQKAKELQIIKDKEFNYIRLTDNDFSQLISVLLHIKRSLSDSMDKKIVHINEHMIAPTPLIGMNSTRFVMYGTDYGINGYGVSSDESLDYTYIEKDNKISLVDNDFFKDKKYCVFKTDIDINKLVKEMAQYIDKEIYTGLLYKLVTNNDLVSNEQVFYTHSLVLEYDNIKEKKSSTILDRIEELVRLNLDHQFDPELIIPLFDELVNENYINKNNVYDHIKIKEDMNGYFYINENTNVRSRSYPSIEEIPNEELDFVIKYII